MYLMLRNSLQLQQVGFDYLMIKRVKILFPLHRGALTSYFSPILGQYAIKNSEFIIKFIEDFHSISNNLFKSEFSAESTEDEGFYSEELLIPLHLLVYKGGKFGLQIKSPTTGFLLSITSKKRRRIYKRRQGNITLLRNYKRIFQLVVMRSINAVVLSNRAGNYDFSVTLPQYKNIRNTLYQKL